MTWQPGESGNPGGRPKEYGRVRDLAREMTEDALETLHTIMMDVKASKPSRCKAAIAILDRAWGRPAQNLEHTGMNGGPIAFEEMFNMTELERAHRIAAILGRARERRDNGGGAA